MLWSDTKAISVLPQPAIDPEVAALGARNLLVYDPTSTAAAYLTGRGITFTALKNLDNLPNEARLLVIGKDALTSAESVNGRLAAWASVGRTVVVLEQAHPLKSPALPAEMAPASNEGRVAFAEDLGHPAFRGLAQKDFFTWSPDEIVFRNAYAKPSRGAKSLIQCGQSLQNSGLVEVPAGKGILLLSQMVVGEKLAQTPWPRRCL